MPVSHGLWDLLADSLQPVQGGQSLETDFVLSAHPHGLTLPGDYKEPFRV